MSITRLTKYLRQDRMPHVWCPGCGNGVIMKAFIDAVDKEELDPNRVAVVSGIGCSSRVTGYLNFNTMHTLHGRAIAFASGVKLARPEFKVVVMGGDGDLLAIGGNHFIHVCRRNMDITIIVFNNFIYGMTGGQYSPTTFEGMTASTAPYGNMESPFDAVKLALSSGATYVARSSIYNYTQMLQYIQKGIIHKGASIIDIATNCHTYFGRYNKMSEPVQMLEYIKNSVVSKEKAKDMSSEELEKKIITGEFIDVEKPTYNDKYQTLKKRFTSAGE
ncbi:MAG: 2-oxoacid:ferredoxin oxidoreductase subunit beta [Kosmotogaceae bacterium]